MAPPQGCSTPGAISQQARRVWGRQGVWPRRCLGWLAPAVPAERPPPADTSRRLVPDPCPMPSAASRTWRLTRPPSAVQAWPPPQSTITEPWPTPPRARPTLYWPGMEPPPAAGAGCGLAGVAVVAAQQQGAAEQPRPRPAACPLNGLPRLAPPRRPLTAARSAGPCSCPCCCCGASETHSLERR